jgi:DNA-binding GntR family transcriptional regulator
MRNPNTTKAYDYLRKRILGGDLPPGAFLSAQSISKDIGVSRTPVREALRQLENDELVTIVPKLGAVVKTLNRDQFQDLLGYRQALETHTAGKAAELRRPEETEQLKAVLEGMREQTNILVQNPRDIEALRQLGDFDMRFHRLLFAMARNAFIREKLERAHILQRMLTLTLIEQKPLDPEALKENVMTVFEEHTNIYEAIRDGDVSRAQSSMDKHMSSFASKVSKRNGAHTGDGLPQSSVEVLM